MNDNNGDELNPPITEAMVENLKLLQEQLLDPKFNVKISVSIICKMLDTVHCSCVMCEDTVKFANDVRDRQENEQIKAIMALAIKSAQGRMQHHATALDMNKLREEYTKAFGHCPL